MNLEGCRGAYIFAEQVDGEVGNIVYELVGEAKNLVETLKTDTTAVLIGSGVKGGAEKPDAYGTDRVILVDDPALKEYRTEPYTHVFVKAINKYKPEIALIGATPIDRDLGPSTSACVVTNLTADCTKLEAGDFSLTAPAGREDAQKHNQLLMTRPAFGGDTIMTIARPNDRLRVATTRPGVMQRRAKEDGRKFKLVEFNPGFTPNKRCAEILKVMKKISDTIGVVNAKTLVSGGRGIGSAENSKVLDELAEVLGGEASCSRMVVDVDWKPQVLQVGQTGKTVRPQLYFVIGISGVIQRLAGAESSDLIIAINRNKDAPIFDAADVGVVDDLNRTVPTLTKQIANYLATKKQ